MNHTDFQKNNETKNDLYQINIDQNFNSNKESWNCPFYNRKMAELMKKICDDSTIIYIPQNGDITVMKIKTSFYYYIWDAKKNKFITKKNKNLCKTNNEEIEEENDDASTNQDLDANLMKNDKNSIENCPKYNKNLSSLLDNLINDSTTIGVLSNGIIMAIKTKSIMITYRWDNQLKDFISQKNKYNKTK